MIFSNERPIFETIVIEYKRYIDMGIYKDGDKLPSVRSLANDLGINPNTVQKAYAILENDGYIKTLEKKGVYVTRNGKQRDEIINKAKEEIKLIKSSGITKEELLEIIEGEYK